MRGVILAYPPSLAIWAGIFAALGLPGIASAFAAAAAITAAPLFGIFVAGALFGWRAPA